MSRRAACITAAILAVGGIVLLLLPHAAQWMYADEADRAARDFDIRMERADAFSMGQDAEGLSTNRNVSEEGFLDQRPDELGGRAAHPDLHAYRRR